MRFLEVDGSGYLGVHRRPAKFLRARLLSDRRLHQGWPCQEQSGSLRHQHRICHHRKIGPSGDAHSHNGGDLRNSERTHDGIISEDPAKVVGVRKDVLLERQEHACGVHEIQRRNTIFEGNHLRAEYLLGGHGEKGASLDRGVVGYDHAEASAHASEAGYDSCPGGASVVGIHFVGCPEA